MGPKASAPETRKDLKQAPAKNGENSLSALITIIGITRKEAQESIMARLKDSAAKSKASAAPRKANAADRAIEERRMGNRRDK